MKVKVLVMAWAMAALLVQTDIFLADLNKTEQYLNIFTFTSSDRPSPKPDLSPEEVVAIQLRAFQENDKEDRGIETVFSFASPENRKYTGPLDFFKAMVKNPTYDPLLNLKKYNAQKMHIEANSAQQIVVITDRTGKKAAFLFTLSKQTEVAYKGCWMTSSDSRIAYDD